MSYYGPPPPPPPTSPPTTTTTGKEIGCMSNNVQQQRKVGYMRWQHHNKHNKRLRKEIRDVPWRDEWEFQSVGKALLSVLQQQQQIEEQQQQLEMTIMEALEMVTVWRSRLSSSQGLAHSIESTATLAQIYWRDNYTRRRRRHSLGVSVTEIRLAYSAAVIRCINGLADGLQQDRGTAASVSNLCGRLGIPVWVVDVRHEASHNMLPSIEVLRMAAATLLEFLKTEYWIPSCSGWNPDDVVVANNDDDDEASNDKDMVPSKGDRNTTTGSMDNATTTTTIPTTMGNTKKRPIDCLQEYKSCAIAWDTPATTKAVGVAVVAAETNNNDPETTIEPSKKRKKTKKSSNDAGGPAATRILSYDPLFGEMGRWSSSDDDDDDDNDDDDIDSDLKGNWNEPVVGNDIFGSAIGTNRNRFALLEPPKKKKPKKKQQSSPPPPPPKQPKKKKTKQIIPQRPKGEKSPTDYAKFFVKSVTNPNEGYSVAVRFLVWGGIGGAPTGRGVLIPGSEKAFPATQDGMSKCWRRYSTLIQVIGRVWPGFVPMLLVHLVDFVLTIENEVISARWMDPSSARKLYFLYGWIQFVLSQRFVASLDDAFRVVHDTEAGVVDDKSKPKQRNDYFDGITMARLEHLQCLEYPLYSLLERCRPIDETNITTTTTTTTSTLDNGDDDPRSTSKGIHDCLLDILGSQSEQLQVDTANAAETQYLESHDDDQNVITTTTATTNTETTEATKLSLDDMEALLAEEKDENDSEDGLGENHDGSIVTAHNSSMTRPASCAWRRCDVWDPCAIGTLPGYPA